MPAPRRRGSVPGAKEGFSAWIQNLQVSLQVVNGTKIRRRFAVAMERMLIVFFTLLIGAAPVGRVFSAPVGRVFSDPPQPQSSGISPKEHWAPHSAIAVWIDRQNLPPQGDQLVEKAMRTWATASNAAFTMRRTFLATDAGIKIYFNGAGGNYGETRPHIGAAGLIDAAEVNIAADAPIEVDPLT